MFVVALALAAGDLNAQVQHGALRDSALALVTQGVAGGAISDLEPALALIERLLAAAPTDSVLLHYQGYVLYRRANLLIGDPRQARELRLTLSDAERALELSAVTLPWPETPALLASVLGLRIGAGGMITGIRLGPRADRHFARAVALGADNPRVMLLRGIGAVHKPKAFGGGLDKAEADFRRALTLYANDVPALPVPGWGEAETWAWLGQVLFRTSRRSEARAAYGKALALRPGYPWVLQVLLTELNRAERSD
jgi:tetratricopeptide (TPR) repeat protein